MKVFSWHEHDPLELVSSVEACIDGACKEFEKLGHSLSDIKAVGITNQRETTIVWDKNTGEPLHNAIVWTDTRSAALVRELKAKKGADDLMQLCGEQLSTYPSCAKLLWLMKNIDAVKKCYEAGNLSFGTVDTWLAYKLNGGPSANVFVSDPSNAGRTMFMNIHNLKYDDTLLEFFDLDTKRIHLPEIVPSSDPKAYGKLTSTVLKGVPITGCLGDQSAALVGQGGFTPGRAKNTCKLALVPIPLRLLLVLMHHHNRRHRSLPPIQRRRQTRHLNPRPHVHGSLRLLAPKHQTTIRPRRLHRRRRLIREISHEQPLLLPRLPPYF